MAQQFCPDCGFLYFVCKQVKQRCDYVFPPHKPCGISSCHYDAYQQMIDPDYYQHQLQKKEIFGGRKGIQNMYGWNRQLLRRHKRSNA